MVFCPHAFLLLLEDTLRLFGENGSVHMQRELVECALEGIGILRVPAKRCYQISGGA